MKVYIKAFYIHRKTISSGSNHGAEKKGKKKFKQDKMNLIKNNA